MVSVSTGFLVSLAAGATGIGALPILFVERISHRTYDAALALAVQNIPDGSAMAVPVSRMELSDARTAFYTMLLGGVPEPIAAVAGFALVVVFTQLFPLAVGFAAGTMIAVVFREMIPSSHGHGYADAATAAFSRASRSWSSSTPF